MNVDSELDTIGLDVTHSEMSHFSDANNDNYRIVERKITSLVRQHLATGVQGE